MSDKLVIHTPCGLPVELCTCHYSRVKYDWDKDVFVDTQPEKEPPTEPADPGITKG